MMWHTRSVTVLVAVCRSCLVKELQTRESDGAVRVALLSARCPSEHLETQQSPAVLMVIQAPAVVSDTLCAVKEEAAGR